MVKRKEQIIPRVLEILKASPQGIRYTQLVNMVKETFPDIPINTIHGTVWDLDVKLPKEIYKPERGLFRHTQFKETGPALQETHVRPKGVDIPETDFYQPFADYLEGTDVCTEAKPLGGSYFGARWGTPDVIGIWKTRSSDPIKGEIIVSAEIKTNTAELIQAFGQACAYKIFSHKVYLVVPKDSREEDKDRVESLCLIFGIGLILFDKTNSEEPHFEIKVTPLQHQPDLYYVNQAMKVVEELHLLHL